MTLTLGDGLGSSSVYQRDTLTRTIGEHGSDPVQGVPSLCRQTTDRDY